MPSQPSAPYPRKRGGRRPGAGAPKGNLNAMKHGETSQQMQHLATALALVPGTRKALLRLMARQRRQQARARTVATTILANLLRSTLQLVDNQPSGACVTITPDTRRRPRRKTSRKNNQPTQPESRNQSTAP